MFVTRKHIARRTFLRGVGVTLALPLLDSMVPAQTPLAKTAASATQRFGFLYVPHGAPMDQFKPVGQGTDFNLSRILKPFEPFRKDMVVVSGTGAAIEGGHAASNTVWLNGVQAKRTEGEDVEAGTTIDQIIARKIGQDTPFPSLEYATEDFTGSVGACDVGYSCAYMNTISWSTPTTPLPMEINPRVAFERLFGDGSTAEARMNRLQDTKSILDSVTREVSRLQGTLGARDRSKLNDYLENVREIERRIQRAEQQSAKNLAVPDAPIGVPDSYDEHVDIMYELQKLAFQGDITRVFTFMMARELSEIAYPQAGCPDPHHFVSHHQNDPEKIEKYARIATHHATLAARFLAKLSATPDGQGSLLDHSLIFYGSGMSNGNLHSHDPLPAVLVGGAAGAFKGGRHIVVPDHTPSANLLINILDVAGIHEERFGPSTGRVGLV